MKTLTRAVRFLLDALLTGRQSELRLRAEVLSLRHQLRALERQVRRPRWQPADRLLLTALSLALPRPAWSVLLVSPETLLRWHRKLIRGKWAALRSPSSSPPSNQDERAVSAEGYAVLLFQRYTDATTVRRRRPHGAT